MSHVGSEVSSYDTVPGWVEFLVKLFFDVGSNVFFDVEFLEGDICTIDGILLHLFVHIGMLDDGFSFGCGHICFYLN
jgi:hypothetical protein